jgi:hypothetical protein
MARRGLLLLPLAVIAAALTWSAAADKPQPPSEAKPADKAGPSVAERLARRIDMPGIDDPDTTLGDALDKLAKASGLAFDVNDKAFAEEQLENNVLSKPIGAAVPAMKNVTAERALLRLLARLPVPSGTTFLVRRESVEITTGKAQVAEVWSRAPDDLEGEARREPKMPLVNAEFDRKPLGEALKELARPSGMNVVVDVRVAEKAKLPVTARFLNTPLDTAVRTLADMAELKPFLVDNLLYVTVRENADRLDAAQRPKTGPDDAEGGPLRIGSGPTQGRRPSSGLEGM